MFKQPSITVSIIIPCYNAVNWIIDTLESCTAQTYRPLEIIIVDDGSLDATVPVAEAYLKTIDIPFEIVSLRNGGASRARNVGWQHANGEWIQFLDADDLLNPNKIQIQIDFAKHLSSNCALVYSDWQRVSSNSSRDNLISLSQTISPKIKDAVVDCLIDGNFVATGSQIYVRSWLEKIGGFDETMRLVEDVNLLIRTALSGGEFCYCSSPYPLFFYRQVPNSTSHQNSMVFARNCFTNADMALNWIKANSVLTDRRRQILLKSFGYVARSTYHQDQETFEKAYKILKELSPNGLYVPSHPKALYIVSTLIGYRWAEAVATLYRRLKKCLNIIWRWR